MAVRISQLLAVVASVKADTTARLTALQSNVTTETLTTGLTKTYRPAAEPRPGEPAPLMRPPQSKVVQVTVTDTLGEVAAVMTRYLDLTRTLDESKVDAHADVRVGGQVLLPHVHTDHLLFLEGRLAELHAFISTLPVLDQAEIWTDEGAEPGQHRTAPVETTSNDTVYFNHVLAEATEHHPAQVQVMKREEVVGFWTTVKFSGAMPARGKRRSLDRLTELRTAVRFAREEANTTDVTDHSEGEAIFRWLLG
jgi:hypothetical protein